MVGATALDGPAAPTTAEIIVVRDFLYQDEHLELLNWALEVRPHLKGNGSGRFFSPIPKLPNVPKAYRTVRHRIQEQLGLDVKVRPQGPMGWFLSVVADGGVIPPHLDHAPEGKKYIRCQLILQRPEQGGESIVHDANTTAGERDLLMFFSNFHRYSCTRIIGNKPRVACMFGYMVPDDYAFPAPDSAAGVSMD